MKKSRWIIAIISIGCSISCWSQQEIILTKYTFNSLFFNPAFAGSTGHGQGTATLQYRNQWLGVEGAPTTVLAAGECSFFDHSVGIGLSIGQESIGANSNTDIGISTSYRIKVGEGFLSGGIRTGFATLTSDYSDLSVLDQGDVFDTGQETVNLFSVGAGIQYHDDQFDLGISIPTMVTIGEGTIERTRHVYGYASVIIGDEYSTIRWEPDLLVKYERSVPMQLTLGVQAWINDGLAPGLHWRLGESLAVSLEYTFLDDFSLTAAYDFTTNDLHDYTVGSMEVMMRYRFGSNR